jgi:hypothetical protein
MIGKVSQKKKKKERKHVSDLKIQGYVPIKGA